MYTLYIYTYHTSYIWFILLCYVRQNSKVSFKVEWPWSGWKENRSSENKGEFLIPSICAQQYLYTWLNLFLNWLYLVFYLPELLLHNMIEFRRVSVNSLYVGGKVMFVPLWQAFYNSDTHCIGCYLAKKRWKYNYSFRDWQWIVA